MVLCGVFLGGLREVADVGDVHVRLVSHVCCHFFCRVPLGVVCRRRRQWNCNTNHPDGASSRERRPRKNTDHLYRHSHQHTQHATSQAPPPPERHPKHRPPPSDAPAPQRSSSRASAVHRSLLQNTFIYLHQREGRRADTPYRSGHPLNGSFLPTSPSFSYKIFEMERVRIPRGSMHHVSSASHWIGRALKGLDGHGNVNGALGTERAWELTDTFGWEAYSYSSDKVN